MQENEQQNTEAMSDEEKHAYNLRIIDEVCDRFCKQDRDDYFEYIYWTEQMPNPYMAQQYQEGAMRYQKWDEEFQGLETKLLKLSPEYQRQLDAETKKECKKIDKEIDRTVRRMTKEKFGKAYSMKNIEETALKIQKQQKEWE